MAALSSIAFAPAALAQSVEGGDTLQEIVVTARLRGEAIQDASISVNVATALQVSYKY